MLDTGSPIDLLHQELLQHLTLSKDVIKPVAPKVWELLKTLSEEESDRNFCYLVIFVSEILVLRNYLMDALKQLTDAKEEENKIEFIINGKINSIFELLESFNLNSKQNVSDEKLTLAIAKELRDKLECLKSELVILYDDTVKQARDCVEGQENVRGLQIFGVGTAAVALGSTSSTILPKLSYFNAFCFLGASATAIFAFVKCIRIATDRYQEAIGHLDKVRSTVQETKIEVQSFIEKINILCIFERLYTDEELMSILNNLTHRLRRINHEKQFP